MNFTGINKISLVDFDDYLSTTLFVSGCNLRCLFCHNSHLLNKKKCKKISWTKILNYLKTKKNKIDAVVITGGEPLINNEKEIINKIKIIKKMGFLIKLDTNGTNPALLEKIINNNLVDYVAMDIKNSFKEYKKISGIKNNLLVEKIKKSKQILIKNNKKINYEFRTTVIKEFHNSKNLLEIAKSIKNCQKFVLQKYRYSDGCLNQYNEINKKEIKKIQTKIKKIIPNTILRGY